MSPRHLLLLTFCAILMFALVLVPDAKLAQDAETQPRVTSIDRDPVSGQIEGIDIQKRLLIRESGADLSIGVALDGIEEIDFSRAAVAPEIKSSPFRVVLTDGSVLFGDFEALEEQEIFTITSEVIGSLKIDIFNVERVERRELSKANDAKAPTVDETDGDPLYRIYTAKGETPLGDLYELAKDGPMLFIDGISEDSGDWWKWKDIKAIVRAPLPKDEIEEFSTLYGIIRTRAGDLIKGEISSWKDGTLTMSTKLAGSFTLESENLSSIIFKNGRFAYLSDLEITKSEEYPFLRTPEFKPEDHLFKVKRDAAQGGGVMQMGGKQYAKGLGVHAISKLTFSPKGRYTKFMADIGVDASAGDRASLEFSVLVDGKPADMVMRWTEKGDAKESRAQTSGVMGLNSPVRTIEVDIAGKETITLIVTAGGDSDINDRANWGNAKFVR